MYSLARWASPGGYELGVFPTFLYQAESEIKWRRLPHVSELFSGPAWVPSGTFLLGFLSRGGNQGACTPLWSHWAVAIPQVTLGAVDKVTVTSIHPGGQS